MSAGRPVSLKPPTTTGSPDTAAWKLLILKSWGRKPPSQTDVCWPESGEPSAERRYRKKALKPAFKRELVTHLITTFGLSISQACRSLNLSITFTVTARIPRVMNPLLPPCRLRLSDTQDTAFRSFSRFCDGKDTRGITKGSTVFTVCWSWIFAVRASNGCRYASLTTGYARSAEPVMVCRFHAWCAGLWPSFSHVQCYWWL